MLEEAAAMATCGTQNKSRLSSTPYLQFLLQCPCLLPWSFAVSAKVQVPGAS